MSKGAAAEVLFDYHIIERGMMTSRPIYDSGYDRIVDHKGNLTRVQIKMTSYKQDGSFWVQTSKNKKRRYVDQFDVMAVYIKPECMWLLMPIAEITGSAMRVRSVGRFEKYINNWGIFYAKN